MGFFDDIGIGGITDHLGPVGNVIEAPLNLGQSVGARIGKTGGVLLDSADNILGSVTNLTTNLAGAAGNIANNLAGFLSGNTLSIILYGGIAIGVYYVVKPPK